MLDKNKNLTFETKMNNQAMDYHTLQLCKDIRLLRALSFEDLKPVTATTAATYHNTNINLQ